MIEVRKQLPAVYYNESRDFQLLGRIFEMIFNYAKMHADNLENLYNTNTIDTRLVELLAKTIGFETRHEYNINNMKIICGCFSDIVKYKGTKTGINKAVSALLNAQGITDLFNTEFYFDTRHVDIYIPGNTQDIILLKDLFEYVLPIGWDYSIISGVGRESTHYTTTIVPSSTYDDELADTSELDRVAKLSDVDPVGVTSLGIVPDKDHRD